jgi:pimeloyl-ACP methyl ester carboxylesterase
VSAFRFEGAFRRWMEPRGMGWEALRYPRPEAGGEARAYRLSPSGPPRGRVLVAHGAGNDALFGFVALFKALLADGYELFSFDMDGHGRESTTRLSAAAMGGAVPAALERAGAGDGVPLHAVGVSFGASVLLRALADLPGTFRSAVLMVAPLRIRFSALHVARELGARSWATLLREREHYGLSGLVPSFGPIKRGAYPLRLEDPPPGAFGYVEALNGLLDGMRLEEAAAAADAPTLLVYGARDRVVPPEDGERLHAQLPRSELRVLARETHLTTPLAPAAVAETVAWLGRHGEAGR